jgi:hypothetical protein
MESGWCHDRLHDNAQHNGTLNNPGTNTLAYLEPAVGERKHSSLFCNSIIDEKFVNSSPIYVYIYVSSLTKMRNKLECFPYQTLPALV